MSKLVPVRKERRREIGEGKVSGGGHLLALIFLSKGPCIVFPEEKNKKMMMKLKKVGSQPKHTADSLLVSSCCLISAPLLFPLLSSSYTSSSCLRCRPNVASPKVAAPSQCGPSCHVAEHRLHPLLHLYYACRCRLCAAGFLECSSLFVALHTDHHSIVYNTGNPHSQSISISPILYSHCP